MSTEPAARLLADRYFGGWFDLALWRQRGVDVVVRLHQLRHCDLRRGRRLGLQEHMVRWPKPQRPDWMDEATYQALPEELELREVRVRVPQRGFRTKRIVGRLGFAGGPMGIDSEKSWRKNVTSARTQYGLCPRRLP